MLDLRELRVGVAFVHQRVEKFHRFPNSHLGPVLGQKLLLFVQDEITRLVSMILPVELANTRGRDLAIIAKFVGLLASVAKRDRQRA